MNKPRRLIALALVALATQPAAAKTQVAETEFAKGAAAAQYRQEAARILGKGSPIFRQDIVQSGPGSFAIVRFQDDAKLTVRPNTQLTVHEYLDDRAEIRLNKGGVRAASGGIARIAPGQFLIETPMASVRVNGAKFDARICRQDCADEAAEQEAPPRPPLDQVVGRLAQVQGSVTTVSDDGSERLLQVGAPLLEKQTLHTGPDSHALLVFRDESRITLQADSEFVIESQKFHGDRVGNNESVMKFVKGGMRALTGAIGKQDPDAVRISTPVATTGIRGTGFDLVCRGACSGQAVPNQIRIGKALPDGLYALVWEGRIVQRNAAGNYELAAGESGFIANLETSLLRLPAVPVFLSNNPSPRPDRVKVDMQQLFAKQEVKGSPAGLYILVRQGHVSLVSESGAGVDLGPGETGYVSPDGSIAVRLEYPRSFMLHDPYPLPEVVIDDDIFTVLGEENPFEIEEFECLCPI